VGGGGGGGGRSLNSNAVSRYTGILYSTMIFPKVYNQSDVVHWDDTIRIFNVKLH